MCGIICYSGLRDAPEVVIEGLNKLEYRGYDSWGVGIHSDSSLAIHKQVGKISDFTDFAALPKGFVAIGHTRWATHGAVTTANAHPHTNRTQSLALVHNGIIENFQELKAQLSHHNFRSETDTEIVVHLIEDNIAAGLHFEDAFREAMKSLKGRFAIVALEAKSGKMVASRRGSPMVVGIGDDEHFIASDILAFSDYTKDTVYMEDGDVAVISNNNLRFTDLDGKAVFRRRTEIDWDVSSTGLDNYEHYMIKEILEQRKTIRQAVSQDDDRILKVARMINEAHGTFFIGCGTAGKVGMVSSYVFSAVARKHINDVVGSEFPNYHHFLTNRTLLVCVSQSGETADTLEAIEVARKKGCKVVSIVNVEGSTMSRMSDLTILCGSGPEKSVCSTKVTTAQIAILTLLAFACDNRLEEGKTFLQEVSDKVDAMLKGRLQATSPCT
ncbi:glutamine--fructose-6-phosphate transaminase (isomerizing) [Candidatus Woesearchaeota archaeon]|nr:glutamine--fructose-6-phosphate transaminase (isomerizing) [Candidatus Woesearchaeota archaeon]